MIKNEYERWKFGYDNEKLISLVLSGKKTATCCMYHEESASELDEISVILHDDNTEACYIKTKNVFVLPFKQIGWNLAKLEGEYENLADWQQAHYRYFKSRNENFSENTLIEFEVFEVISIF